MIHTLTGKGKRSPKNLTTDGQDSLLCSASDVEKRWYDFLSVKFVTTETQ